MIGFDQALRSGQFAVTVELGQAHELTSQALQDACSSLGDCAHALVIRDQALESVVALSANSRSSKIQIIPGLNVSERNPIAHQSDLLGLRALGISTLLLETSDSELPLEALASSERLNEELRSSYQPALLGARVGVPACGQDLNTEAFNTLSKAGCGLLLLRPSTQNDDLAAFIEQLIEHRLTWSFSVLASLDATNSTTAELAEMIKTTASLPGLLGINLVAGNSLDELRQSIQASGVL